MSDEKKQGFINGYMKCLQDQKTYVLEHQKTVYISKENRNFLNLTAAVPTNEYLVFLDMQMALLKNIF